jgi:hypothetical protein
LLKEKTTMDACHAITLPEKEVELARGKDARSVRILARVRRAATAQRLFFRASNIN